MGRLIAFLGGAASLGVGIVSYFTDVQLPFNCRLAVFSISTTVITLDMVLMAGGVLLLILALAAGRSRD